MNFPIGSLDLFTVRVYSATLACNESTKVCATLPAAVAGSDAAEVHNRVYEESSGCNPAIYMFMVNFESEKALELAVQR